MGKLAPAVATAILMVLVAFNWNALFGPQGDRAESDTGLTIVYVSAANCPPCDYWKDQVYPGWRGGETADHVAFRTIHVAKYTSTDNPDEWPGDLRWLIDVADVGGGAPRFLLLDGGDVILNVLGLSGWTDEIVPTVRGLVRDRVPS